MREANAIEVVVGWMDAMRRGDLGAVGKCFDPRVRWNAVGGEAVCRSRDDVLGFLRGLFAPCPDDPMSIELEPGLLGAEAVELVSPDAGTAVLGAKVEGLGEVDGEALGQLFNVFRVRHGRIVEVSDFAYREEALRAASARAPQWL
jgi:hypothetical protein